MATRAKVFKQYATEIEFIVAAGGAATAGQGAKFGVDDGTVLNSVVGDTCFGVFMKTAAAGEKTRVCVGFVAIVSVKVGTGGVATRGLISTVGTNGFTNAVLGGGTVGKNVAGMFLQSGVPGDDVSMGILPYTGVGV